MAYKIGLPKNKENCSGQGDNPHVGSTYLKLLVTPVTTGDTAPAMVDPTEGRIIAVEICSNIWLAFDDDFNPGDGHAVFYADELPFLATKDAQTLKEIHKYKLVFPGSRVRQ
jgi:hypothetical protein